MRLHSNHNRRVRIKSNAVYDILDRLHMSQSELAREAGLSTGYVSQVISGKRTPSSARPTQDSDGTRSRRFR